MAQCGVTVCCLLVLLFVTIDYSVGHRSRRLTTTRPTDASEPDTNDYRPPRPLVEAYSPRGLSVSIPHQEGIELFAFHGKVNSQIRRNEAGNLSEDILHPTDGRWVFQTDKVSLRVGDVVNYWIFLQINGTGHRVDNLSTVITGFSPGTLPIKRRGRPPPAIALESAAPACGSGSFVEPTTKKPRRTSSPRHTTPRPAMESCDCPEPILTTVRPEVLQCECDNGDLEGIKQQLNVTLSQLQSLHDKLTPLQSKVESLNELLLEVTKDMDIGTKLLLTGVQPPGTNPLEAVRSLIVDKLELYDLDRKIQQATRTESGILFEMSSPLDKKRILYRASLRLINSPQKIIDYRINDSDTYDIDSRAGVH